MSHFLSTEPIPPPVCMSGLGMQSGAIPDKHISASSNWNHGHRAANARLHFHAGGGRTGAWSAKYNNGRQFLQVNFGRWVKITRVSLQGRQDANQWVKKFTLSYSYDGVYFRPYLRNNKLVVSIMLYILTCIYFKRTLISMLVYETLARLVRSLTANQKVPRVQSPTFFCHTVRGQGR